jgi:hypothetical protein
MVILDDRTDILNDRMIGDNLNNLNKEIDNMILDDEDS